MDARRRRVLHVLDHSHPVASGYAVRSRALLRGQRDAGIEVRVLTSPRQGAAPRERETVDGIEHLRTPPVGALARPFPFVREWVLMRATERRLARAIREVRPEVIHAHSPVLNAIPALRSGRRAGIPVVYEVRAFWEDAAVSRGKWRDGGLRYRVTRHLESRALRRADAVVAICEGVRREVAARGVPESRIAVVPNGAEPTATPPPALREGPVLGYFGSFYGYEGLDLLVRALPLMLRRHPGVRLVLAGGGPAESGIRAVAAECGVTARIRFAGRVDGEGLARCYAEVDALVFPRRQSRLTELVTPLKPLEAMARGRAVLASDVGGHRELVTDGVTGRLFRPDDPDAIARAVVGLFADPGLLRAVAGAGQAFVARERTWASVAARYGDVYDRLDGQARVGAGSAPRPAVAALVALP